jgi:hypothetical protein
MTSESKHSFTNIKILNVESNLKRPRILSMLNHLLQICDNISAQKTFNKKRPKKSRYNSPSHHVTQRIAKIKLKFLSPRVEKSKENSLVFLLNMNNSLDLHKIN